MSSTYLIFSALLLFNSCFNEVTSSVSQHSLQRGSTKRNEIINTNELQRLKFIDLNNDVLFIIFNQLNLMDLINVASTNSLMSSIAAQAFRHKYQDYRLDLGPMEIRNFIPREDTPKKCIQLTSYQLTLSALQHFRNEITRIYLFETFSSDILKKFTEPLDAFEKVFEVSIDMSQNENNIPAFNRLFPQLRRLNLNYKSIVNTSFEDFEFPNLEHLSVHVEIPAWSENEKIVKLLRKNQQIKSLKLNGFPSQYIHKINVWLPNLENMTFCNQEIDIEKVLRMKNVKHLAFEGKLAKFYVK